MTTAAPAAPPDADAAAPPRPDQIVTTGLGKTYGTGEQRVEAVRDLDLRVRAGEVFGLLGPNGAGKTTTIGMLTTRVVPTAGGATVGGIDVVRNPVGVKQRIGVVPQTNTLDRSIDVEQNLVFHGRYFGLPWRAARARAEELLVRFRLTDKARAEVAALSGGMAQRLMVARAVFHRPEVLFLDEPTSGLDPQSRIALWELLRELNGEGQTVLLTTHYMEEADQLCDRVGIIDGGRLLALGSPAELKAQVEGGTLVRLFTEGDVEALATALRTVEGVRRADARPGGVRLETTTGGGLLPRLLLAAEHAGHAVTDVRVAPPSLEGAFLAVTGKDLRE